MSALGTNTKHCEKVHELVTQPGQKTHQRSKLWPGLLVFTKMDSAGS